MRIHPSILLVVLLISGLTLYGNAVYGQLKAFPEAEGFGAFVTGGRGGTVYHVTNLNDSGAGSLRDAISQPNRTVVFDTSGVINISSQLVFSNNITLAGQTAPGDGITVYGKGVSLSYRSNVIVRNIRFHQGAAPDTPTGQKALNITNGNTMIFDHISVQWGRWDNIGMTVENGGTTNTITFQNCIIGEPINPQYLGGLVDGADNITLSHNLFIDNNSRNPKAKGTIQYINNVIYNWGGDGLIGGHSGANHYLDAINNYFIQGPSSSTKLANQFTSTDNVYQTGNMKDMNKNGVLDGSAVGESDFYDPSWGSPTFSATRFFNPAIQVTTDSAQVAYNKVVASAGSSLVRDPVDTRLISHLTSLGTLGNSKVFDESVVGGQPAMTVVTRPAGFDSDNDGMPDTWETAHGLNPNLATDRNLTNPVGYTYIEQYINELGANHGVQTWHGTSANWATPSFWTSALPTNDDNAYVVGNGAGALVVTVTGNIAACFSLHIGGNGSPSGEKVTVNGTLPVNDTIYVGDQNNGTLEIQSGAVQAWNVQLGNTVGGTTYTGSLLLNGGILRTYQVVLGGGTPGNWTTGGSCNWSGGTLQAIGTLKFAVPTTISAGGAILDSNGFTCTVSGILSGNGGLTKTGSGTVVLTASNTYTGPTTINNGVLQLAATGQIAADISTAATTATFEVNGGTHTVGNISGIGNTNLLAGSSLTASSIVQGTVTLGIGARITIAPLPGGPTAGTGSPTAVPEPSTWAMLMLAAMGLGMYWRLEPGRMRINFW